METSQSLVQYLNSGKVAMYNYMDLLQIALKVNEETKIC